MGHPRNDSLISNARILRKNMTRQERHLWYDCLRCCEPRFRRQEIIGSYVADFYCYEAKLVIELDGSQHFEPEKAQKDRARTAYFHTLGIRVLRFANNDIDQNFIGVYERIVQVLELCGVRAVFRFP